MVRPVLTYASECWTLPRSEEALLLRSERRILRKIYDPVCADGIWKMRTNAELAGLYRNPDIVRFGCTASVGVLKMTQDQIPRLILDKKIHGTRRVGRPRLRWIDGVAGDARSIFGIRNWRAAATIRGLANEVPGDIDSTRVVAPQIMMMIMRR
ncbi:uncharacterized protein [Halyomorpha halys]|uniref:uncharacterized protein n=1 Tax=Halyomorpha halys TaxID=286706 RepID=UPI0034D35545